MPCVLLCPSGCVLYSCLSLLSTLLSYYLSIYLSCFPMGYPLPRCLGFRVMLWSGASVWRAGLPFLSGWLSFCPVVCCVEFTP